MRKLNQKGEGEILLIIAIGLIAWGVISIAHAVSYEHVFNNWTQECYRLGGAVQSSGAETVDCFVNNKPCQVNGFQQYETNNPNPYFDNLPICTGSSK